MVLKRELPKAFNPLLQPDQTPKYEDLVARRRLGQTDLKVRAAQLGTSNATKSKNLGMFDYAHLKAPLPRDMLNPELFGNTTPDFYFLMRRSSDGYVSASGMFKAAFPSSTLAEEETERNYIRSLATTSREETAGNIWIPPTHALQLAELYKMHAWIRALLDPQAMEKGQETRKPIQSPPPFHPLEGNPFYAPPHLDQNNPNPARHSTRLRSSSPGRVLSPAKKIATPRKRLTKAAAANNASALATQLDSTTADHEKAQADDGSSTVNVNVDSGVRTNGEVETRYTNVKVELPSSMPDLSMPEDPEHVVATAKEMVAEAQRLEGQIAKASRKRKADQFDEDDEDDDENRAPAKPAKRVKTVEVQLRKEKIKSRALVGLSLTLAIGSILPYVL